MHFPQEQHKTTSVTASESEDQLQNKRATVINLLPAAKVRLSLYLPEYNLLDFLLTSQYMVDLRVYIDNFENIPDTDAYKGKFANYRI